MVAAQGGRQSRDDLNSRPLSRLFRDRARAHNAPFQWHQKRSSGDLSYCSTPRGIAVRDPFVDSDGGRLVGGAVDGPLDPPRDAQGVDDHQRRR